MWATKNLSTYWTGLFVCAGAAMHHLRFDILLAITGMASIELLAIQTPSCWIQLAPSFAYLERQRFDFVCSAHVNIIQYF